MVLVEIVPTQSVPFSTKRRKNFMLFPPPSGYTFDDFSNFYLLYEMNEVKFDNSWVCKYYCSEIARFLERPENTFNILFVGTYFDF